MNMPDEDPKDCTSGASTTSSISSASMETLTTPSCSPLGSPRAPLPPLTPEGMGWPPRGRAAPDGDWLQLEAFAVRSKGARK